MIRALGAIALCWGLTVAAPAHCEEAEEVFHSLYAQKLTDVAATRGLDDDLALAAHLLDAGRSATNTPRLLQLMCDKAYELGSKDPAGSDTAADAMTLLAEHVPSVRSASLERILTLRQRDYLRADRTGKQAAGESAIDALLVSAANNEQLERWDEAVNDYRRASAIGAQIRSDRLGGLQSAVLATQQRQRLQARDQQLRQRLQDNPADREAARELVDLMVIDMDAPERAAALAPLTEDADLIRLVQSAGKSIDETTEAEALALGDWYRGHATAAAAPVKGAMFVRARAYYERFLAMHEATDLSRTKAELALQEAQAAIRKLGIEVNPASAGAASALNTPSTPTRPVATRPLGKVTGVKLRTSLSGQMRVVNEVTFSPDGRFIAACGGNSAIILWDAATGEQKLNLEGHRRQVTGVAFVAGGQGLISTGRDATVRAWDLRTGLQHREWQEHGDSIRCMVLGHDGAVLVTGSDDRTIRLWDLQAGKVRHVFRGNQARVQALTLSPDGSVLVSAGDDGIVQAWDMKTGQGIWQADSGRGGTLSLAFSPNGKALATAGDHRTVTLRDAATGQPTHRLEHEDRVTAMAFAADNKSMLTTSGVDVLQVWDITTGEQRQKLTIPLRGWRFAGDGLVLIGLSNNVVQLWDVQTEP